MIRRRHRDQRPAAGSRLCDPSARPALGRTFPQARHPRRLLQSIARRRLAAVRTVQSELALKFGNPRLQRFILGPQRRYQRDQVFRGRHARRFANYPILELETAYAVDENLPLTIDVAQPGQLLVIKLGAWRGAQSDSASSCFGPHDDPA